MFRAFAHSRIGASSRVIIDDVHFLVIVRRSRVGVSAEDARARAARRTSDDARVASSDDERRARLARMRACVRGNDFQGASEELGRLVATYGFAGRQALTLAVQAAANAGDATTAVNIVESMIEENIVPCARAHVGVMKAFARSGRRGDALEWLKMYLYGVREDGEGASTTTAATRDEKYGLTRVVGDMIEGDRRRASGRGLNIMLFTTVMNAAAMAGDRAMVQEVENMMFDFNITGGANVLHIMLKLERVAGSSESVEKVWDRFPKKARWLKSHQERVVAHAILGRGDRLGAPESRALALAALEEMFTRIGRRRTDEEFDKLKQNNFWGTRHCRWTGQRGAEEFSRNLDSDDEIRRVGAKEVLVATNTVLDTFANIGDLDTVNEWFMRLENDLGVEADARTLNAVLRAEYKHEKRMTGSIDLDKGRKRFTEILEAMKDRGIAPDKYALTTLLLANAEQGHMAGVAEVLKLMKELDIQLDLTMYNILLSACANANDLEAALSARESMRKSGITPGPDTFVQLFVACANQAAEFDLSDGDLIVDEEALGPLLPLTRSVLDDMEVDMRTNDVEHSVESYTALIKARGAVGQTQLVLKMLTQPPDGLKLDDVAIGVGVMALAKREPTKAIALANTLAQGKDGKPLWLLNCVLIAYGHLGQMKAAHERVQAFIADGGTPNVTTYNMLFRAAAESGSFAEYAPLIMSDMSSRGLTPDDVTRKYLTTVCTTASVFEREMAEELLKKIPGGFTTVRPERARRYASDASIDDTNEFAVSPSYALDDDDDTSLDPFHLGDDDDDDVNGDRRVAP